MAAGLIVLHGVLAWLARLPGILTAEDDAKYLLLARVVRHLHYGELWRSDNNAHTQYPPVYPAFLAIAGAFGDRYAWLVLWNIAFSCASLWLVWRVVRRLWGDGTGLVVLAVLVPSYYLVARAGMLMSEPLFMLFLVAAAAALAQDPQTRRTRLAGGGLVILAALTRSAGAPFVAAVVLLWLLQRRWKAALALTLAGGVTVGSWLAWSFLASRGRVVDSYVSELEGAAREISPQAPHVSFLSRTMAHFSEYTAQSLPLVMGFPSIPGSILDNVVSVGLGLIGLAIGLLVFWKRWRAAALLLAFELALLLAWPYVETRFFIPIEPLLVTAIMVGVGTGAAAIRPALRMPVMVVVAALLVVGTSLRTAPLIAQRQQCRTGDWQSNLECVSVDQASFFAAARYVKDRLPPNAVLINAKPQPLYLYAGHASLATRGENTRDPAAFLASARAQGARWILLGSLHAAEKLQLPRALMPVCTSLAVDTTFPPRTILFRILETPGADSTACRAIADYRRSSWGRDFDKE